MAAEQLEGQAPFATVGHTGPEGLVARLSQGPSSQAPPGLLVHLHPTVIVAGGSPEGPRGGCGGRRRPGSLLGQEASRGWLG